MKKTIKIINDFLSSGKKYKCLYNPHSFDVNNKEQVFLYADNRLALKYFIGEKDPFTNRYGSGLENYVDDEVLSNNKLKSIDEIINELLKKGIKRKQICIYSVLPDINNPKFIIKENYIPNEKMSTRIFPSYKDSSTIFMNEEYIIDDLFKNNMMPQMAGGLLFQINGDNKCNEIVIQDNRGRLNSSFTAILNKKIVKHTFYKSNKFDVMHKNHIDLKNKGIKVVNGKIIKNPKGEIIYECPFINASIASVYLQKLFDRDIKEFIKKLDLFISYIRKSGKCYPDMVPLNAFYVNNDFVFFDQEFVDETSSIESVIVRTLNIIYENDINKEKKLSIWTLYKKYNLMEHIEKYIDEARNFTNNLIIKKDFNNVDKNIIKENREKLNYSTEEYEKLFYNPFANLKNKKIILFGSENVISKFIEMYKNDYNIEKVFYTTDNISPNEIKKYNNKKYKFIICDDEYDIRKKYLLSIGITTEIAIYKKNKVYPGRQASIIYNEEKIKHHKKYHIGYIAGVFDLFHIGHLNLIKKAKQMCDYLIVGVVTDKGVIDFKNVKPVICFNDRIKIIRACRYVDEAVEIPYFNRGTIEAFEKYHFDVQFSGSDYENNPLWIYHRDYLRAHGSDMIFFNYTKGVSTSKLKEKL